MFQVNLAEPYIRRQEQATDVAATKGVDDIVAARVVAGARVVSIADGRGVAEEDRHTSLDAIASNPRRSRRKQHSGIQPHVCKTCARCICIYANISFSMYINNNLFATNYADQRRLGEPNKRVRLRPLKVDLYV